jgi:cytochrome P450
MSDGAVFAEAPRRRGGDRIPRAGVLETVRQTIYYRDRTLELLRRLYDRHGPVVLQNTPVGPTISLFGPEANRFLLLDRDQQLSAKRAWDLIMGRIFTNGLLLRDGEDHRHHRRIMQPAFQSNALREYVERMNPHIAAAIADWHAHGDAFRAFSAFKELTLGLACSIFLGIEIGDQTRRLNRAFEATVAASMSIVRLPIPGLEFARGLRGRGFMLDLFGSLLPSKRAGQGSDMFSRLCHAESEEGERFGDADIVDHLIFLMMAAHDTTTSTLTSMLYELARHPEWQERVRAECRAHGSDGLGFDELNALADLDLVLQETLRRYPPLSTIPRVSERAFAFGGYEIPADAMVVIYPIHTHHMEEHWREPFRFDPERFTAQRAEHEAHTHLFIPFGGGAHLCIGYRFAQLQIKAILYQLCRRYRWSVPHDYTMPVQQAPISKPKDGLPVLLERLD